jgi:hypothetical protein
MTERSTFDSFEQRIAGGLERYVAPAADPRPAIEIAEVAMRPRGLMVRARNVSRRRRFLLLGLAAAFVVPAAYIVAGSIRPPVPEPVNQVQPSRPDDPRRTPGPSITVPLKYVSIFVRRDGGPEPGVSIFAVRPDGGEVLVRKVPDSIAPGLGPWSEWGTVSESGWLALGVEKSGGSWPMSLIDLGDQAAKPWVINEADTGGIGPRWGPTGLVAADAGSVGGRVVIADPETHSTRIISTRGLVGGGPSIVWSADGSGIVGSTGSGAYEIVPLDGGAPRPDVGQVFDPRGGYGPGLAELRICLPDVNCPSGDDGRVQRVELDGSARTIWQQQGTDRALGAVFGGRADEYWLSMDHDSGRQVALVHVHDGRQDAVATVNRDATWGWVAAPLEAPDQSAVLVQVDMGAKPGAVLVPPNGARQTFHTGHFAGFVDTAAAALFATAQSAPSGTISATGKAYALPSLAELIAAELKLNPGRRVLGKASRDAIDGQTAIRTFEVHRDQGGGGEAYLDCVGPSNVTLTSGRESITSPCLGAGSYGFTVYATSRITVTASGDTSWRVVIYSP